MTKTRSRSGTLLVELGVVVLGVLIALAADSWWQNRQEVERELAYLQAIRVDMIQSLDSLDRTMEINDRSLARARRIVDALSDPATADSTRAAFNFTTVYPPALSTGTLDALISSGDLSLIRNAAVRGQIVRASAGMQEARDYSQDLARTGFDMVAELTLSVWPALVAGGRGAPTYGDLRAIPAAAPQIFNFTNLIFNLQYWCESGRRAAAGLLAAVEGELSARGVELEPVSGRGSSEPRSQPNVP